VAADAGGSPARGPADGGGQAGAVRLAAAGERAGGGVITSEVASSAAGGATLAEASLAALATGAPHVAQKRAPRAFG